MGYIKQTDLVTRWKNRRLQFFNFRQGQFLVNSVPSSFMTPGSDVLIHVSSHISHYTECASFFTPYQYTAHGLLLF